MACADLSRIINSDQVQAKLREVRQNIRVHNKTKANPLKNKVAMLRVNPFAKKAAELDAAREKDRHAKRAAAIKAKRSKAGRKSKAGRNALYQKLQGDLTASYAAAEKILEDEAREGNYVPGDTEEEDEGDE